MFWLDWRQKHLEHNYTHIYYKPERKLHLLNNNSEWKVFPLLLFFPLWWMVKCAGVGFLWYESPHVSFRGFLAAFGRNCQSQSRSFFRDCPGLWLEVLSRSGRVYNQHYWLDDIGTADVIITYKLCTPLINWTGNWERRPWYK